MDSDHVLVLFFGLVLVGAAVALAYSSPAVFGGDSDGVGGASLTSFETTDAYCGDPNSTSGSTFTRDIRGGEALVFNYSVPVASNGTTVSGSLDEFGSKRYILAITRETPEGAPTETPDTETPTPTPANETETPAGNGTTANDTGAAEGTATATDTNESTNATAGANETATDGGSQCHPEVRYNATIHIAQPDEYTVIVTYDGELVGAHWREGSDGGSYDAIPEQPESEEGQNETAADIDSIRPDDVVDSRSTPEISDE